MEPSNDLTDFTSPKTKSAVWCQKKKKKRALCFSPVSINFTADVRERFDLWK